MIIYHFYALFVLEILIISFILLYYHCQGEFLIHRVKKVGKEDVLMTDKLCKQCWQKKRGGKRGAGQAQTQVETNEASEVAQEEDFPYLAAVEVERTSQFFGELLASDTKFQRNVSVPMPHHIFDGTRGWMQAPVEPHPVVTLKVYTDESDYNHLCLPCPKMRPQNCSCAQALPANQCFMV